MVEQMLKSSTLERSDETLNKVKVLGYAQVPAFPREARRGFKFLVAVVFSLIASFVVGAFVDSLDHSIRRRDEIEDQLGVPHLASLGTHQT
jgi:capsular polysaccharide biosynthesis protein